MTNEDLKYIFMSQIQRRTEKLWFMLIDEHHKEIMRHPTTELDDLVPLLSNFDYNGNNGDMPRFSK